MTIILLKAVSPGRAELHVTPWEQGADHVELSVRRSEGAAHLDVVNRQWVGDEQWIRLQGASLRAQTLVMPVGPEFVDPLLAGTQGPRCRGFLRVAGGAAVQYAFRIEPDVLPGAAAGAAPTVGSSSQLAAAAVQEPVEPQAAIEQEPKPEPAPEINSRHASGQGRRTLALALGLAGLLVAAGIAAYYFLWKDRSVDADPQPSSASAPAALPPAGCTVASLADASADKMGFVQACVRDVKDSEALLKVIRAARDSGQCEIAQRLYANRANAGDITIALAYAAEYDPASSKNTCFKAEAATARYWYEAVLERDPKQAGALASLQSLPN